MPTTFNERTLLTFFPQGDLEKFSFWYGELSNALKEICLEVT